MAESRPVVLLATDGPSTRIVYHALRREFGAVQVILEDPVPRRELLRRRIKKLGFPTVAGQVAFMALVAPLLERAGRDRVQQIKREFRLDDSPIPPPISRVHSVNSDELRDTIRRSSPPVVVVNGTRIIGPATLGAIQGRVINMHAGITPLFRGVHGAYWALAEGRPDLVGTTVHFVDEGIDTGSIIEQATFDVSHDDSFATYPYLHVAAGLPVLLAAVRSALDGSLQSQEQLPDLPSRLRSHPTVWRYLATRLRRGVR